MYHDTMMSCRSSVIAAIFAVLLPTACTDQSTSPEIDISSQIFIHDHPPTPQEDLVVNVGDRVFFDFDSAALDVEASAQIRKLAGWMQANPGLIFRIEGHTDIRGTSEYNCRLGLRQTLAVRDALIEHGIDPARLHPLTYGEFRPAMLGEGDRIWSQNRRVMLNVASAQDLKLIDQYGLPACLRKAAAASP